MLHLRWGAALGLALAAAATVAACGSNKGKVGESTGGVGGGLGTGGAGTGGNLFNTGGAQQAFQVTPSVPQVYNVGIGLHTPTVTYSATLNGEPRQRGLGRRSRRHRHRPDGPGEHRRLHALRDHRRHRQRHRGVRRPDGEARRSSST